MENIFEKGGKTKVKYDYIPQKAIDELSYTIDKVTKGISGDKLLSGVYVKSDVKSKTKSGSNLTAKILGMTDDEDKKEVILEKDVKEFQKYISDKLITAFYLGLPEAYDFKGDYSYGGGIITMRVDDAKRITKEAIKNAKNKKFEMGLKYPQYDFEKLLGKPIIKDVFGKLMTFNDGSTEKYKYRLWIWKDCVIGQTLGSDRSKGGYSDYTYGKEPTLMGGFKSIQTSKASKLESIINFMAKDKDGFVKDNNVLFNGLGGANFETLDSNKIKYAKGGMFEEWSIQTDNEDEHFENEQNAREFWESLSDKERKSGQYFRKSYFKNQDGEFEEDEVEVIEQPTEFFEFDDYIDPITKAQNEYENEKSERLYQSDEWVEAQRNAEGYAKGGAMEDSIITVFLFGLEKDANDFFEMADKFTDYDVLRLSPFAIQYNGGKEGFDFLYERAENYESNLLDKYAKGGGVEDGGKQNITHTQLRNMLKDLGYKVSFKRNSLGVFAIVKDLEGKELPTIFMGEQHRGKWLPVIEIKNKYSILKDNEKVFFAKGGKVKRSKHSLMQDRRRVSSEPWEVAYQKRKAKMEAGGTLPTPFGQAGLVGETGATNEMDLFAMGGGLPQGVHQYYAQTYNPAYPTPYGYAKGGEVVGLHISRLHSDFPKGFENSGEVIKKGNNKFKVENGILLIKMGSSDWKEWRKITYAKGGMMQGYNDRLDESLGNRDGVEPMMKQSYKDRRDESKGMEKSMGRRAYQSVGTMDKMANGGYVYRESDDEDATEFLNKKEVMELIEEHNESFDTNYKTIEDFNKGEQKENGIRSIEKQSFAKGGKIGFDGLAKKVAKRYEGKPVKEKFRSEYGKTYSKAEALEVGKKVAGKVYLQQQSMAKGGKIQMSEVYNVNGKDYLFSTPIQNDKGTYTGWDAYEVVYDTFDGEKHLNYTKTKRGRGKYFPNGVKRTEAEDYFAKGGQTQKSLEPNELQDLGYRHGEDAVRKIPDAIFNQQYFMEYVSAYTKSFYDFANVSKDFSVNNYAKGGKTQGYNDKLDESLGNTKGKRSTKEQNYKDRRNESEAMEKKGGKRKYASVKTMDKGNRSKRKTPMSLAKEIRKEGEKWQDAVKRASAMLKKEAK